MSEQGEQAAQDEQAQAPPSTDEGAQTGGEQATGEAGATANDSGDKRDMSWYLDRIWTEIKDVSKQVEAETRRGGRIAKLHFEIRRLSRRLGEQSSSLGRLVYEAHKAGDGHPDTSGIEGYDAAVAEIDAINAEIATKQAEVDELKSRETVVA